MREATTADAQLDRLLSQDPAASVQRETQRFERVTAGIGLHFVLFGAGRLGRIALAGLRRSDLEALAFADNNPALWGGLVDGVPVLSPAEAVGRFRARAVFVVSVYTAGPVRRQLEQLGVGPTTLSFASLAWQFPDAFLPNGALELPHGLFAQAAEVRRGLSVWADEVSRREYVAQVAWRTSLRDEVLPPWLPAEQTYFPEDLVAADPDEAFVDCGAFDGDTVREFLRRRGPAFRKVVALEPDPDNFARLQAYGSTLPEATRVKLDLRRCAAGARRGVVRFDATGTAASTVGAGALEVESVPLDELDQTGRLTYVKMDIEGAEPEALAGAPRVLEHDRPVWAVCLYHRQEHLWQIPLLLSAASGDYRLYLRRYSDACWELVCYAIPAHRLVPAPPATSRG